MADTVTIKLAVLGNGVVEFNVPAETTVGELREMRKLNPHLDIIIGDTKADDDTVIPANEDGPTTIVATPPVKAA